MTDEEKKAIEYLKRHIIPYYGRKGTIEFMLNDTLLNLIEKQSKEIEELKANKGYHLGFIDGGISKKYEMEDKIKAKIEELKETADEDNKDDFIRIEVLQSLFEKEVNNKCMK